MAGGTIPLEDGGQMGTGPLSGTRIVEFAGIGPGPFCGQLLADLGADVIVVERPQEHPKGCSKEQQEGGGLVPEEAIERRGKRSIILDLKAPAGREVARALIRRADALIEGFRPGVMERLGLGPQECARLNPRLVYGRMTGWGQSGPMAARAGHDLNYIGLVGALHAMGAPGRPPPPPLNLVGDFGGGGMLLAVGLLAGLIEAERSGRGQTVDAAIVDGTALLMGFVMTLYHHGRWGLERAANMLDGGAPFYRCYETRDGRYMAVAAIEPQFFARLLEALRIAPADFGDQWDRDAWPTQHRRLEAIFRSRSRAAWVRHFEGIDACVTPVLDLAEAMAAPENAARGLFVDVDGMPQPAPAPRFERTKAAVRHGPRPRGGDAPAILAELGFDKAERAELFASGAVARDCAGD